MLQAQRTTSSGWASAIGHALAIEGLDIAELFADAGLDPELLSDPDARIAQDGMTRVWHLAVERSGNPAIGLHMAHVVRPAHFSVVGYSLMSSRSLLEGFNRVVRYQRLIGESADLMLQLEPGSAASSLPSMAIACRPPSRVSRRPWPMHWRFAAG